MGERCASQGIGKPQEGSSGITTPAEFNGVGDGCRTRSDVRRRQSESDLRASSNRERCARRSSIAASRQSCHVERAPRGVGKIGLRCRGGTFL